MGHTESRVKRCWKSLLRAQRIRPAVCSRDQLKSGVKGLISALKQDLAKTKERGRRAKEGFGRRATVEPLQTIDEAGSQELPGSQAEVGRAPRVLSRGAGIGNNNNDVCKTAQRQVPNEPVEEDMEEDLMSAVRGRVGTESDEYDFAHGTEEGVEGGESRGFEMRSKDFSNIVLRKAMLLGT